MQSRKIGVEEVSPKARKFHDSANNENDTQKAGKTIYERRDLDRKLCQNRFSTAEGPHQAPTTGDHVSDWRPEKCTNGGGKTDMTTLKVKMTNYPSPFAQADSADSHASAVDFISEYDADSNGAGVWNWDSTPQIADEWYENEKWMDDFASNEAIYEETSDKQWEELWQSSSPITEPSRQGDDTEDAQHQRWGHLDVSSTEKIQSHLRRRLLLSRLYYDAQSLPWSLKTTVHVVWIMKLLCL